MSATALITQLLNSQRQAKRLLRLSFPREDGPKGALFMVQSLDAHEALGEDFHFRVEVLSDKPDIELKDVLAKMATVSLRRSDGSERHFNGYVFDFRFLRNDAGLSVYDMVLMPWMSFLHYRRGNRLFHGLNVEAQTAKLLGEHGCADWSTDRLGEDPSITDACQFDESDHNYLHRRWEAQGWSYHYEHRKDGHTLVLRGDSSSARPIDGSGKVPWVGKAGVIGTGLQQLVAVRQVASTSTSARSFDFKTPGVQSDATPTINAQGPVPGNLEVYEYAGNYGIKPGAAQAYARLRMLELEAAAKHFEGAGTEEHLQAGRAFTLTGHEGFLKLGQEQGDNEFLLLSVHHQAQNNHDLGAGRSQGAEYQVSFTATRKKVPWHPGRGRSSSEPRIYGLQTAVVVGPKGEEIHCDEYGRVRVQFHWDREGAYDEKSSAWVRVASTWAGSNFGFMAIPRIGQEVLVQFLDGNPDRPLITGRVYNQKNMPPWDLPANKTQTGLLTRSTKGGTGANANAIRFEDKKGSEELWLHAEKDQRIEVENDESHWVGRDRTKTIDRHETVHVKGNRTETVDLNETITVHQNRTEVVDQDESITIHQNRKERVDLDETISVGKNRSEDVGINESIDIGANQTVKIGANRSVTVGGMKTETVALAKAETIGMAKALTVGLAYQTTVGAAMNTTVALSQTAQIGMSKSTDVGKTYSITAGEELTITVGKASLTMKADGTITINGNTLNVGTTATQSFNADGEITVKGKKVLEN